jgi:hypothetical protein
MICIKQIRVDAQVGALECYGSAPDKQPSIYGNMGQVLFTCCSRINSHYRNTWLLSGTTEAIPFLFDGTKSLCGVYRRR